MHDGRDMSLFEMKLPDVGEGVAEAEIVEWLVAVGDEVTPDTVLAEVLTDKATVEVSPPVAGTVVALHGEPGDVLAVGTPLVGIDVADGVEPDETETPTTPVAASDGASPPEPPVEPSPSPESRDVPEPVAGADAGIAPDSSPDLVSGHPPELSSGGEEADVAPAPAAADDRARRAGQVTAAPAVRRRAHELGIDLATVPGSGPDGRVVHADLDRLLVRGGAPRSGATRPVSGDERVEPVRGVRRKIAERLSATWSEIPHITYVEAVDVTELEALRAELNSSDHEVRLTLLPFFVRAIVVASRDQPEINAHYDHAAETLTVHTGVHVGIATQTDQGLLVPVVRHAESLGLHDVAAEIARVTDAARTGRAARDELSGSTITITSLGAIGGVATTPILNAPEVAIVGINKMEVRPVWRDGAFQPRTMINLSSSFDHRMVDGWDAANFVQRLKTLLETPALLFVDGP